MHPGTECKASISRNIPAERRWKIIEMADDIRRWTGSASINARQTKDDTSFSYHGLAGRHIIHVGHDEDFDDNMKAMERVAMAHRERIMQIASHWQEREACDWHEATNTMVDEDSPSPSPWRMSVIDGVRRSIDEGILAEDQASKFTGAPAAVGSIPYDEIDVKWSMPNGTNAEMKVMATENDWRMEQLKHEDSGCYFSFGRSVHYVRVHTIPESIRTTLRQKRAESVISHPFIGPADLIVAAKKKMTSLDRTVINLTTIRQLAQRPPIHDRVECLETIATWKKRGWM